MIYWRHFSSFLVLFYHQHRSPTTQCPDCPHKSVRHFCWWNKVSVIASKLFGGFFFLFTCGLLIYYNLLKYSQAWCLWVCFSYQFIATPIQNSSNSYEGRRAMILLKHKLLKGIVLRRTKKGRASDLALPPRIVSSCYLTSISDVILKLFWKWQVFLYLCHTGYHEAWHPGC